MKLSIALVAPTVGSFGGRAALIARNAQCCEGSDLGAATAGLVECGQTAPAEIH
jgi:hypothetical protein